jgi:hypothetical protein
VSFNDQKPPPSKVGRYIALALFAALFGFVVYVGAQLADHFLF